MQDTIKHIVISGGGPAGFSFYGAVKESHKRNVWSLENIVSMHGTSIGSILCTMLCLNYEWEVLDDFLIKRPWQQVFKVDMYTILDSFQKRGIYDIGVIENTFLPLFNGKDISIDVTLAEFYELNHIDLHIYASEIHGYEQIDFSHTTHPDWRLVDAIYCSSSLPVAFPPLLRDGKCYCDGGLISNYPIRACLEHGADKNEILGIKMLIDRENQSKVVEKSSVFDYVIYLINKLLEKRLSAADMVDNNLPHEIKIVSPQISLYTAYQIIMSPEERVRLIDYGAGAGKPMVSPATPSFTNKI
jgi:predicted acylesterase/phospholipase RssA